MSRSARRPRTLSTVRKPRTFAEISAHPWVESVSDERSTGEGIWVYFKAGVTDCSGGHTLHESTVKECLAAWSDFSDNPFDAWLQDPAPGEAAPVAPHPRAEAAPSIADAVAEASARINAEGEAATARIFDRLGRIRAGLAALAEADAAMIAADTARPILPGEAAPPPAPSHGVTAPVLPVLYPVTSGASTRAEAVRDVERCNGGGVAVICSGSDREAFRLPDTVSHCGAAAALKAAGWILSPELEALAQRWRDISGDRPPSPEAVAIAEAVLAP